MSVDNALVLAIMVSILPKKQQKKALLYGIVGAFAFRILAVLCALILIKVWWLKLVGGGYLFYIAAKGLMADKKDSGAAKALSGFWTVVLQVELMDMAFSIDSVLAAVALTHKEWLIITGGVLGIIMMRVAAGQFIKILDKYPILKKTAYVLVLVIGAKLVASVWWHSPIWLFFGILFAILGGSLLIHYIKSRIPHS